MPLTTDIPVVYSNRMPKTIQDYLPSRTKTKKMLIQARIDYRVVIRVKKIMKDEGLSWADVVGACLQHFVDDRNEQVAVKHG